MVSSPAGWTISGRSPTMCDNRVHISYGVSKLGCDIPSVNFPPIVTCNPNAPCFKKCYARKGRFAFSHTKDLLFRNLEIWRTDPERFELEVQVSAYHARFFRYFSSGDIPDIEFLEMMVRVARRIDKTEFLAFTKRYEWVNDFIREHGDLPANLHIVLSAWGDWLLENPFGLPVAYVRLKDGTAKIPENARPCPKYCGDCVMTGASCWDLKRGESVCFSEH